MGMQRVEVRVKAHSQAIDVKHLVQPDGAFTGVSGAQRNAVDGPWPADNGESLASQQGHSAVLSSDTAPKPSETSVAVEEAAPELQQSLPAPTSSLDHGHGQPLKDTPRKEMSADAALRRFLAHVHKAGLMVDQPIWRLEARADELIVCATFHMRPEFSDDLFAVFRRCSLFSKIIAMDVMDVEDHTDVQSKIFSGPPADGCAQFTATKQALVGQLKLEKMLENVRTGSQLTFDYLTLLVTASLLAGLGLASNNVVVIIASMLVSPLMGPVLAVTFGLNVHDFRLARLGFRAGAISMVICGVIGFLLMVIFGSIIDKELYCDGNWPTEQMLSRGDIDQMWLNFLFAATSAVGVAVGVVSNNAASMVGTAISASLLPPAVNCGLFWGALAMHSAYNDPQFLGNSNIPECPDNPLHTKRDWFRWGGYSMLLTVVNIVCIIVIGGIMLRLQELGPGNGSFWQQDVALARKLRKSMGYKSISQKLQKGFKHTRAAFVGKKPQRSLGNVRSVASSLDEADIDAIIAEEQATALDENSNKTVAGRYFSLLSVAQRSAAVNPGTGDEALADIYSLFGTDKKAEKQRKEKRLQEIAEAGDALEVDIEAQQPASKAL